MTNSPEGLTFIDYSWVATLNGYNYTSHTSPDEVRRTCRDGYYISKDEVVNEVQTPHVVPNGKWVAEQRYGCNWHVGVEHDELEKLEYHDKNGIYHLLYVCDKPFGFVAMNPEDVIVYPDIVKPGGRKTLVYARQVHKGELGRGVFTPPLRYVRQAQHREGYCKSTRSRRHRGNLGWVRIEWLAEAAGLSNTREVTGLILGFWQFSGHLRYEDFQPVGVYVDIVTALLEDEIRGKLPEVIPSTRGQFVDEVEEGQDSVWIRRGFAMTILRLLALGVKPEVPQPA